MQNSPVNLKQQLQQLEKQLQNPLVYNNREELESVSREYNRLKNSLKNLEKLEEIKKKIIETEKLLSSESNQEMIKMAEEELNELRNKERILKKEINEEKEPTATLDKKNAIMEIRAGTGGEEAALFAAALFRMYSRFAEKKHWQTSLISSNRTDIGGLKEIIFEIKGTNAYSLLKNESGVHRVQRIPETEKSGRVHTSAASVVVLPKADPIDIKLNSEDLKMEFFRASGHGGQNVQKNATAIRITHLPTNLTVSCQDERSQTQNKERAFTILRSRLLAIEQEKRSKDLKEKRLSKIGSGDRSEKIRTYNYPQARITDHRVKKSWYNLEQILDGELNSIINELNL